MSKSVNINIRVDSELKRQAEEVYAELGMNLSAALNVFLRASVRSNGMPFDLRLTATDSRENERERRHEAGQTYNGLSRVFEGADSLPDEEVD